MELTRASVENVSQKFFVSRHGQRSKGRLKDEGMMRSAGQMSRLNLNWCNRHLTSISKAIDEQVDQAQAEPHLKCCEFDCGLRKTSPVKRGGQTIWQSDSEMNRRRRTTRTKRRKPLKGGEKMLHNDTQATRTR